MLKVFWGEHLSCLNSLCSVINNACLFKKSKTHFVKKKNTNTHTNNKINFVIWLVWMYRCFVCPVWIRDFAKFAHLHLSHPFHPKPCTFTLVVVSQSFLCTCRTFYSIIYYWQAFALIKSKRDGSLNRVARGSKAAQWKVWMFFFLN